MPPQTLLEIRAAQRANSKRYHAAHKDDLAYKAKVKAVWERWYAKQKLGSKVLYNEETLKDSAEQSSGNEENDFLNSDTEIPDYIKSQLLKIKNITVRERLIIGLRFGLDGNKPQKLQAIAFRFNLSRQRVEQILNKILSADYEEVREN